MGDGNGNGNRGSLVRIEANESCFAGFIDVVFGWFSVPVQTSVGCFVVGSWLLELKLVAAAGGEVDEAVRKEGREKGNN